MIYVDQNALASLYSNTGMPTYNKLHKIFTKLDGLFLVPTEDKMWVSAHTLVTCYEELLFMKGKEPPVCIPCDGLLAIEHLLLFIMI